MPNYKTQCDDCGNNVNLVHKVRARIKPYEIVAIDHAICAVCLKKRDV